MIGMILMNVMTFFLQSINSSAGEVSVTTNIFFLVLSRPVYIIGFSMMIFPVLIGSSMMKPLVGILSHNFWTPFSRLSYVALLVHGVFMQFREFNVERGQWANGFDAILMFLAYAAFSFLFSLYIYLIFENPFANIYYELVTKPIESRRAQIKSHEVKDSS
jgi:peptidoglycan/LPS O-acetylase OafA/YrhL